MSSHDDRLRDNPLADQLSDLDIETSDKAADPTDQAPQTRPEPPPESREELSDEELFRSAVEDLDDDDIPPPDAPGPPPATNTSRHNRQNTDPPASPPTHASESDANPSSPPDTAAPTSDRELFEQAVDNLDPAEIYAGKYQGRAGASLPDEPSPRQSKPRQTAPSDASSSPADEEKTRRQAQHLRDAALFEKMVGSVEPLDDRDKYRRPGRKRPSRNHDDDVDPEDQLLTPLLPCSGDGLNYVPRHDDSQRALLARHRKYAAANDVPELNLRGETRKEAVEMLRDFIARHRRLGARFARIVTGRGLRSESTPVLKPTVLNWLHGPGLDHIRGYAPERTHTGDYGSLIVELGKR